MLGRLAATNTSIPSRFARPCALLPDPALLRSTVLGKTAESVAAPGAASRYAATSAGGRLNQSDGRAAGEEDEGHEHDQKRRGPGDESEAHRLAGQQLARRERREQRQREPRTVNRELIHRKRQEGEQAGNATERSEAQAIGEVDEPERHLASAEREDPDQPAADERRQQHRSSSRSPQREAQLRLSDGGARPRQKGQPDPAGWSQAGRCPPRSGRGRVQQPHERQHGECVQHRA